MLEPLKREHVREILQKSTWHDEGLKSFKFHEELTQDEYNSVIDHLIKWTGGAPRPLIYAYMLRAFDSSLLKTEKGLKSIFEKLVIIISRNEEMEANLGPVSRRGGDLTKTEQEVYDHYIFQSWLGNEIDPKFRLNGKANSIPTFGHSMFLLKLMVESRNTWCLSLCQLF